MLILFLLITLFLLSSITLFVFSLALFLIYSSFPSTLILILIPIHVVSASINPDIITLQEHDNSGILLALEINLPIELAICLLHVLTARNRESSNLLPLRNPFLVGNSKPNLL